MNLSQYKSLGVINRTPDSFSDRGLSLNQSHFESQLQSFLADPTVIVDVGFESTAPMNDPISAVEELMRFNDFLADCFETSFANRTVSFDTYKIQNFSLMAQRFLKLHPEAGLIFNDVSGVLDEELKAELLKYKGQNFYYIYTFSHIPDRDHVLEHMKYLDDDSDIIEQVSSAFKKAQSWFASFGMQDQLLLDPGFGFSKTYEQNWRLIDHFSELETKLLAQGINNALVVGLSKKSFLKKALGSQDVNELEALHQECIQKIQKDAKLKILFRVHDPKILRNIL